MGQLVRVDSELLAPTEPKWALTLPMVISNNGPETRLITLRIHVRPDGIFQVRDGELVVGTSHTEMLAVWTAVMAADELAKLGHTVRVVRTSRGKDVEEYLIRGRKPT